MKRILVHYSEIGIKGGNRRFFEKKLVENIKHAVGAKVERRRGRIILRNVKVRDVPKLRKIAGISNFSIAEEVPLRMPSIIRAVIATAKKSPAKSFRITASRSDKSFRHTSPELNKMLGGAVWKATKKKVDLHNPGLEIFVEIAEKAYIYSEKQQSVGGLPVGTAGRLVCLLSGGIDSPVAAYRMMSRGCRIIFVHFHNYDPFMTKVRKLVSTLSEYQGSSKLYLVPFKEVQQSIIKKTMKQGSEYRMLLYRRLMMQIAEQVARKEHALGLVTGDSVAQVASQTLQNLNVIYEPVKLPILSPLIGTHKQDIIRTAEEIGTYRTSIIPYTDCCSVLIGKHPATHAQLKEVKKIEKRLKISTLVKKALKKAEIERI
ncbi:MAG: tRNA 4-thiouridine(8) synthase ThiI [Candidatus Aenigmarchaeota archaeon]|nr:tRNA 4-thiouridine(8) synthase ThiI [Candidatus Aenigmarchaeota archaeon]